MLATLASERTDGLLDEGSPSTPALNSGFHLAYLVGAGLVAVALAIAVFVLRRIDAGPVGTRRRSARPDRREQAAPEPAYSEGIARRKSTSAALTPRRR